MCYRYMVIWPANSRSRHLQCRFLLKKAILANCITRECHEKLTDHDNPSYKAEMTSLEPGQTDYCGPLTHAPRVNEEYSAKPFAYCIMLTTKFASSHL